MKIRNGFVSNSSSSSFVVVVKDENIADELEDLVRNSEYRFCGDTKFAAKAQYNNEYIECFNVSYSDDGVRYYLERMENDGKLNILSKEDE